MYFLKLSGSRLYYRRTQIEPLNDLYSSPRCHVIRSLQLHIHSLLYICLDTYSVKTRKCNNDSITRSSWRHVLTVSLSPRSNSPAMHTGARSGHHQFPRLRSHRTRAAGVRPPVSHTTLLYATVFRHNEIVRLRLRRAQAIIEQCFPSFPSFEGN